MWDIRFSYIKSPRCLISGDICILLHPVTGRLGWFCLRRMPRINCTVELARNPCTYVRVSQIFSQPVRKSRVHESGTVVRNSAENNSRATDRARKRARNERRERGKNGARGIELMCVSIRTYIISTSYARAQKPMINRTRPREI